MRALAAALIAVRLPGHVPVSRLPNSSKPTHGSTRDHYAQRQPTTCMRGMLHSLRQAVRAAESAGREG